MASMDDDSPPDRKRKKPSRKGPHDIIKKMAVVLREGVVFKNKETNEVFMPTTITMSNEIKPDAGLRQEISFTKSMTPEAIKEVLKSAFPILANTERFFCAKAVQKKKLDFCGELRIWSGEVLDREIKGHYSVLYIYCEEVNSDQHPSLTAQVENMHISRNESSPEDHCDSGFETCTIPQGESLASWFDLCENEDAGKDEHSRWEMSSMEPNKTDGGVEKDVFDSEEGLSQGQRLFSEQGNSHIHLSLPDDASVQSRRPEVENKESQDTPLSEAAKNGHIDIVRLLIENGADVNEGERDTPLCEAAKNGHTDIVRLLIENGADINKRGWDTPLCEAAAIGHTDIVRLLIENGADVKKGRGMSLLGAARNGHTDIVRLLIENGADVNKGRLKGKKTESLPKMSGKKLITQTEMTCPRDIVEEGECGRDSMTDVELGLSGLHLSPGCEQFYPCIMDESPGDSRI